MNNLSNKIVWFTGAPGSKWSGVANVLQAIPQLNFNISDRSPEREYVHAGPVPSAKGITHTGVYFGPGHGYGEEFHLINQLSKYSVENIISECWSDSTNGKLLVKSHFFSHHLNYLSEEWPDNPIIMIFRPNDRCEQGWFGAGGFDITYPKYAPYYKDSSTMKLMIAEHNHKMIKFCNEKNITRQLLTEEYLKNTFNWSVDMVENKAEQEWIARHLIHIQERNDVYIAVWNKDALRKIKDII